MIVGAILVSRMMESTGFLFVIIEDAKRSGHAEMHQQHVAGAKIGKKIFGAAAEAIHGLALEPGHKILLKRESEVFAPDFGFHKYRSLHGALQPTADRLDFR